MTARTGSSVAIHEISSTGWTISTPTETWFAAWEPQDEPKPESSLQTGLSEIGSKHLETSVTVLTPSLPERQPLLEECRESVSAQTVECEHLVHVDQDRVGPVAARNHLAVQSATEWILPLDDDDVADPQQLVEVLLDEADGADIVYPWCRMEGRSDGSNPNKRFTSEGLFKQNFIPVTALIRCDLWKMLGGQRPVQLEDWDFMKRAFLHGAKFKCVPEVLWTYRFMGQNQYQGQR